MATDVRQLPRNDQVVLGAGLLAFVLSLLPIYYGVSVKALGIDASKNYTSWHSWATLALLLMIAATVIVAVQAFSSQSLPDMSVGWNTLVAGLASVAALIYLIRSFTLDSGDLPGGSYGLKWGAYVIMILLIVQAIFAYLRMRDSGEQLPWAPRTDGPADETPPPAV